MIRTRFGKLVARPFGMFVCAAATLGVVSLAYSGLAWWHGDDAAWKSVAATNAGLLLLACNLLDVSRRKTRSVLLTASCLMVVAFYGGIVMSANHQNTGAQWTRNRLRCS